MAKLAGHISEEIFQKLKDTVDFYWYRGTLCARSMPKTCRQPGSTKQKLTWDAFRSHICAIRKISASVKDTFRYAVKGSSKVWSDFFSADWLVAWNWQNREPPLLYDISHMRGPGFVQVRVKVNMDANINLYYFHDKDNSKRQVYSWKYVTQEKRHPQERLKTVFLENWPSAQYKYHCAPDVWHTFMIPDVGHAEAVTFTVKARGSWVRSWFTRVGVVYYGPVF